MAETQQASYDESNQTLFKREFHRKEAEFRTKVGSPARSSPDIRPSLGFDPPSVVPLLSVWALALTLSLGLVSFQVQVSNGDCHLTVTRADLFKTSFFQMVKLRGCDLRKHLMVQFDGEGAPPALLNLAAYPCLGLGSLPLRFASAPHH